MAINIKGFMNSLQEDDEQGETMAKPMKKKKDEDEEEDSEDEEEEVEDDDTEEEEEAQPHKPFAARKPQGEDDEAPPRPKPQPTQQQNDYIRFITGMTALEVTDVDVLTNANYSDVRTIVLLDALGSPKGRLTMNVQALKRALKRIKLSIEEAE